MATLMQHSAIALAKTYLGLIPGVNQSECIGKTSAVICFIHYHTHACQRHHYTSNITTTTNVNINRNLNGQQTKLMLHIYVGNCFRLCCLPCALAAFPFKLVAA